MASQPPVDIRALIRANRATAEVTAVTDDVDDKEEADAERPDPRFLRPVVRPKISEDSGTYSVVIKRPEDR